jgi:hypothetical protein
MRRAVLYLIIGALVGHGVTRFGWVGATPSSIIAINDDTVNHIGVLSEILHDNSDTIMRYAHYLNPHTQKLTLCPECHGTVNHPERTKYETPVDEGVGTLDDLHRDAKELNSSVRRIIYTIAQQRITLTRTLEKLRMKE